MSKIREIIRLLKKHYPDACCSLAHESPFTLLVSTILSAQATDKSVNLVTPKLFAKYPDAKSMAAAKLASIENIIRPLGLYKNKAKSIKGSSKMLVESFGGEVPRSIAELTQLPGVGRKTANVVLGNAFGIDEGICVDTHVGRLSRRLGLSDSDEPLVVEQDLMKLVPRRDWTIISHLLIAHGRAICKARKPECDRCFLRDICPKIGV
jgi:endonuclease-3